MIMTVVLQSKGAGNGFTFRLAECVSVRSEV